ncbi:MAG TPA: phosphatidylserine decarboxylase [Bdellovibrionota bacterium]|jgi:phosphatidylserine decarboxylase
MAIEFWNRKRGQVETESVYGGWAMNLLYGNPVGFAFTDSLLVRKAVSQVYGGLQSSHFSGKKVIPFVRKFRVEMGEFEPGPFRSFNDFFIRRFRAGRRKFPQEPGTMGAFAEARYFAFSRLNEHSPLPIKGLKLEAGDILGDTPGKERFADGPCLLARLCPVDYHRFHFPDAGRITHFHTENGKLHSVNPAALARKPDLFLANERQISLLETEDFGLLAYVEVGALCVGRIVQTHPMERPFERGGEKGYFLFGASTVIVYGEKGAWTPEADLLEHTKAGREVLVELGQPVARRLGKG